MKTKKRVILENRESGLKIYLSKRGYFEILLFGKNIKTPDNKTEFENISVFKNGGKITGLRVKRTDKREMSFLPDQLNWFSLDGEIIFKKVFPFGTIAFSLNGECLHNFEKQ